MDAQDLRWQVELGSTWQVTTILEPEPFEGQRLTADLLAPVTLAGFSGSEQMVVWPVKTREATLAFSGTLPRGNRTRNRPGNVPLNASEFQYLHETRHQSPSFGAACNAVRPFARWFRPRIPRIRDRGRCRDENQPAAGAQQALGAIAAGAVIDLMKPLIEVSDQRRYRCRSSPTRTPSARRAAALAAPTSWPGRSCGCSPASSSPSARPLENGFYYDIDSPTPITRGGLPADRGGDAEDRRGRRAVRARSSGRPPRPARWCRTCGQGSRSSTSTTTLNAVPDV